MGQQSCEAWLMLRVQQAKKPRLLPCGPKAVLKGRMDEKADGWMNAPWYACVPLGPKFPREKGISN